MTKTQYLKKLKHRLGILGAEERERICEYYAEIIDDKTDELGSEEAATADLGDVNATVAHVLSEYNAQNSNSPGFGARLTVAIVSSIIWLPLYISIWAVLISFFAAGGSMVVSGGVYAICAIPLMFHVFFTGVIQLGACVFLGGFGLFMIWGSIWLTRWTIMMTAYFYRGIKYSFRRAENV